MFRLIDYAAMEHAAAAWRYGELHKDKPFHDGTFTRWSKTRVVDPTGQRPSFPYHFSDGVQIAVGLVDLAPDDHFLSPTTEPDPTEPEGGDDGDQA